MSDIDNEGDNVKDMPLRARVLYKGASLTTHDRNKQYGEPVRNMQDIGDLWSAYICARFSVEGLQLTGEDVAHLMTLMKVARAFNRSSAVADNYVDGATYQAIAAECAVAERGE